MNYYYYFHKQKLIRRPFSGLTREINSTIPITGEIVMLADEAY